MAMTESVTAQLCAMGLEADVAAGDTVDANDGEHQMPPPETERRPSIGLATLREEGEDGDEERDEDDDQNPNNSLSLSSFHVSNALLEESSGRFGRRGVPGMITTSPHDTGSSFTAKTESAISASGPGMSDSITSTSLRSGVTDSINFGEGSLASSYLARNGIMDSITLGRRNRGMYSSSTLRTEGTIPLIGGGTSDSITTSSLISGITDSMSLARSGKIHPTRVAEESSDGALGSESSLSTYLLRGGITDSLNLGMHQKQPESERLPEVPFVIERPRNRKCQRRGYKDN